MKVLMQGGRRLTLDCALRRRGGIVVDTEAHRLLQEIANVHKSMAVLENPSWGRVYMLGHRKTNEVVSY